MSQRRVVITGLGIISPVGSTVDDAWANIINGKSGIREITKFDVSRFPTRFGGSVQGFDVKFRNFPGADSLDTVELVMALEEEFETEIPDEEAEKITTVQQAIDYVSSRKSE